MILFEASGLGFDSRPLHLQRQPTAYKCGDGGSLASPSGGGSYGKPSVPRQAGGPASRAGPPVVFQAVVGTPGVMSGAGGVVARSIIPKAISVPSPMRMDLPQLAPKA